MADLTDAQFSAYIDRILECRRVEDEAKEDTKQAYADLKDAGGDKTEAGLLVRALRMDEKDAGKAKAREEMLEEARLRYRRGKASHVRAREATQSHSDAKCMEVPSFLAVTRCENEYRYDAEAKGTGDAPTAAAHFPDVSRPLHAWGTSELTDTQEQSETDPAGEYPAQVTRQPEGERSTVGEAVASPAPRVSPTPANAPRLAADDEAAQANPIVVGALSHPQPSSSPGAVKAPEAETSSAVSGAARPKPDCLHPETCKLHFTTALCWKCNDARNKARVA